MKDLLDILRVDDNGDDLAFFHVAVELSRLNIYLHTARNGQQAIDYLEARGHYANRAQHPLPDVVVLDLVMPGMSGLAFLAWRSASRRFVSLPVVVFTGCASDQMVGRAYALGATKCLAKPLRIHDWRAVVEEIWQVGGGAPGLLEAVA